MQVVHGKHPIPLATHYQIKINGQPAIWGEHNLTGIYRNLSGEQFFQPQLDQGTYDIYLDTMRLQLGVDLKPGTLIELFAPGAEKAVKSFTLSGEDRRLFDVYLDSHLYGRDWASTAQEALDRVAGTDRGEGEAWKAVAV